MCYVSVKMIVFVYVLYSFKIYFDCNSTHKCLLKAILQFYFQQYGLRFFVGIVWIGCDFQIVLLALGIFCIFMLLFHLICSIHRICIGKQWSLRKTSYRDICELQLRIVFFRCGEITVQWQDNQDSGCISSDTNCAKLICFYHEYIVSL